MSWVQVLLPLPLIFGRDDKVEIWKDYIYNYQVSNLGHIKNKITGRTLKLNKTGRGYLSVVVSLGSSKKRKCIKIHRAVAELFIPNPNNLPQVNHINGDKTCNEFWNLEWCNNSFNVKHAYDTGLHIKKCGQYNHNSKLTRQDVEYIRKNYKSGDKNYGIRALSRKYQVNKETIRDALYGINWK